MVSALIPILVRLLLAGLNKGEARQYIKDKFDGWKEYALLAVFDVAWAAAELAAGQAVASVPFVDEHTWLKTAKIGLSACPEYQAA